MDETLKQRQEAGRVVEQKMFEFLAQFAPAHELKLGEVLLIAAHARSVALTVFSDALDRG